LSFQRKLDFKRNTQRTLTSQIAGMIRAIIVSMLDRVTSELNVPVLSLVAVRMLQDMPLSRTAPSLLMSCQYSEATTTIK
jgi:hypothetical protein